MKRLSIAAFVAAVVFGATAVMGQAIGIYADPDGNSCNINVVQPFTDMYVLAINTGRATDGIVNAEFSITGLPAEVVATATPNPAATFVLGDPLTSGGYIGFTECQSMPAVILYTVRLVPVGVVPASRLQVWKVLAPDTSCPCWSQFQICKMPQVNLCDSPFFTNLCLVGGEAFLNDPDNECNVAVEGASWSMVKAMFN